jgi:phage recombination protein Bet
MSTALATTATAPRVSALAVMAARLNVEPNKLHGTLKATVFKNATDDELLALVVVANEYKLNPLTKEIYAFPAKGGGIVPVVSVDGWVSMVNDHPQMDGMEFETHRDEKGGLHSITCSIWRKDRNRPIKVTEILSECRRATEPWKMENRMLRHKALMQCARYAFGFSGISDEEEALESGIRDVTPPGERPARAARSAPPGPTIEEALVGDTAPAPEEAPEVEEAAPAAEEEFIPAQAIESLEDIVREAAITWATFQAKVRAAGVIPSGSSITVKTPPEKLRKILANAAAIIDGSYNAGGDE